MRLQISDEKYVVISVMGPHAGEAEAEIFKRKIGDIEKIGKTFWLFKSHQGRPDKVQNICKRAREEDKAVYCIFIEASSKFGATPTKAASLAKSYSADRKIWENLPTELSRVTGKVDTSAYALVFDELELVQQKRIDLWDYANYFEQDHPVRISQGGSTLCGVRKNMKTHTNKIKAHIRKVIALGRLCDPFCVWLK